MKKLQLKPEEIIVPGEYEIENEVALRIYFDVCRRGHASILHPALVADSGLISAENRVNRLKAIEERVWKETDSFGSFPGIPSFSDPRSSSGSARRLKNVVVEELRKRVKQLEEKLRHARFYLLDGNHRTTAATLARVPLYVLLLEFEKDLVSIRVQGVQGAYPELHRQEDSLIDLVVSWENYVLDHIDNLHTVRERVERLAKERVLPSYMTANYHHKSRSQ